MKHDHLETCFHQLSCKTTLVWRCHSSHVVVAFDGIQRAIFTRTKAFSRRKQQKQEGLPNKLLLLLLMMKNEICIYRAL